MTEDTSNEVIGGRFRDARKKCQLTLDAIAEQLNLKKETIEAIENDNFDALPQPSFTRGYLRSYAKIVGIDESIIDDYNRVADKDPELTPVVDIIGEPKSNHPVMRWSTAAIVVVLCTLLLFWLFGSRSSNQPDSEYVSLVDKTVDTQNASTIVELVENESVKEIALENEVETFVEETGAPSEEVTEDTELLTVDSLPPLEPPDETAINSTVNSSLISIDDEVNTVIVGDDILRIKTNSESWVEVIDANGARLIYDMLDSTQARSLRGTAPFKVFLGNAPDISMEMNGVVVATPTYNTISKTTRFYLDSDGALRSR